MTVIHRKAAESGVKFHCDVCSCDCTNLVRIRCAECQDYDLCVQCFSQGASTGAHQPYHDYMIVEQHAYPIFDPDWGADEELLLIEGAETNGLGNWQDISEHIGGRSKEEVDAHYKKIYLESKDYPLPEMNKKFDFTPGEFAERKRKRLEDRRNNALALLPKTKPTASVPSCHEVQGWMPGRLEFETELENEAEITVKDMVFEPDDAEQEVELKTTILEIYNSRLTTRAERKRAIIRHGLLEYRKMTAIDKKRSKEERDLLNKIRPFARLMTEKDFEMFQDNILTELQCRRRISQLQEYRRAGLRTLEQASKYEREKAVRLNALNRLNGLASNYMPAAVPPRTHTVSPDSIAAGIPANATPPMGDRPRSAIQMDLDSLKARKPTVNPLDISHAADVELLSPEEQTLCSQLRILPKPYLAIKETLFRELLRTGGILKKKTARELIKIDVNKTGRIYEFFQQQKWI